MELNTYPAEASMLENDGVELWYVKDWEDRDES